MGYLDLMDLIYYKKEFMKTTHKKGDSDALFDAYGQYNLLMQYILSMDNNIEFVVSCIAFLKFEVTHRFLFTARLASYMKTYNIPKDQQLPISFQAVTSRFMIGNAVFYSPFLVECSDFIIQAFHSDGEDMCDKIDIMREIIIIVFKTYLHRTKKKLITKEDFDNYANFLKNEYKITDYLQPIILETPDSSSNSYYNYIRFLFEKMVDPNNIEYARKNIKKS